MVEAMVYGESQKRLAASAVGGSTARACDGCLSRRARWYCGADDAFLCQSCDTSVHSANLLAGRHRRLRLPTSSSQSSPPSVEPPPVSNWRKRKARTPRPYRLAKPSPGKPKAGPFVPDLEKSNPLFDGEEGDEEAKLICCVPELDPLLAELCSPLMEGEKLPPPASYGIESGFIPFMEMDLGSELDVDCLLAGGLEEQNNSLCSALVVEGNLSQIKMEPDVFRFLSSPVPESLETMVAPEGYFKDEHKEEGSGSGRVMGLRLDYDAIIAACSRQGCSPWPGGGRPEFGPDDCLPEFMGMVGGQGGRWAGACGVEEREARVLRYRKKRRTRHFVKKIRYEVRKLNAEKRPRIKGRFVKLTAITPTGDRPAAMHRCLY